MELNGKFFSKWIAKYEERVDKRVYNGLLSLVQNNLKCHKKVVTLGSILDIIEWKSTSVWRNLPFNRETFEQVQSVLSQIWTDDPDDKISIICEIYGIGVPVGSTFLHFLYPETHPIIDARTIRVLNQTGHISQTTISENLYRLYMDVIHNIKENNPSLSIRDIDNALF